MKHIRNTTLALLISVIVSPALAQKRTAIDSALSGRFDRTLQRINKADLSNPKEVKKAADEVMTTDETLEKNFHQLTTEADNTRLSIEARRKEYISSSNNKQQLDKDLLPILAAMPEPVVSLQQAAKTITRSSQENIYTAYLDKIKAYREGLTEQARKEMSASMKNPEQLKKEAYENSQRAQDAINNNPAIQEMGGMDKLKNMTQEQRIALAKQMAEKVKQNPSAYAGQQNDLGKAFTQKMMSDPQYAAKFNRMNDEQKQDEYKSFLVENGLVDNNSREGRDQRMADRDKAALNIALDNRITQITKHAQEMMSIAGKLDQGTTTYFDELNKKLSDQYARRVAALPLVEMGEVGHEKNTYPVDISYNIMVYPIEAQNAVALKEVWRRYAEVLKITIGEYNDLLSEYWGKDKATDEILKQKGLTPAALSTGICDQITQLAKQAEYQTNQNASWQRTFSEKVLQVYE